MAGLTPVDDPLEDDGCRRRAVADILEELMSSNPNPALCLPLSQSWSQTPAASNTHPPDALITNPLSPLEPRQNNPQDCANLITASVNRATVEISRTIIALNATFSQQLQQASISASNGIKSAQNSASSMVAVVSQSASIATSSAFSSVTVARIAVTSANLAFSSVSSASSTDVSRLSSSLSLLQANLNSAQVALSSASESAAAASAAAAAAGQEGQTQPLTIIQEGGGTISLTPTQIAAIVIGVVVGSILLVLMTYFFVSRMRNKERDSYLSGKGDARSPRKLPSRLSSAFRTGNTMVLRFNPTKSSDAPPPSQPAHRQSTYASISEKSESDRSSIKDNDSFNDDSFSLKANTGPLTLSFTSDLDPGTFPKESPPRRRSNWPLNFNVSDSADSRLGMTPVTDSLQWPLAAQLKSASSNPVQPLPMAPPSPLCSTPEFVPVTPPAVDRFAGFEHKETVDAQTQKHIQEPIQEPIKKSIEEPIEEPTEEPIEESIKELIEEPIEEFIEEFIDEVIPDPTQEPVAPVEQSVEESSEKPIEEVMEKIFEEPIEESIEESVELPAEDPIEKPIEKPAEEIIEGSAQEHIDGPVEEFVEEAVEELPVLAPKVPVPGPVTLPEEESLADSILPDIDTFISSISRDSDGIDKKHLSWRTSDIDVTMSPRALQMHSPARDTSPPKKDLDIRALAERRERTISPLRRNPVIFSRELNPSPPALPTSIPSRIELSTMGQDPVVQDMPSPAAITPFFDSERPVEESEADERQIRGRSMIRTSDIIEARLSAISQLKDVGNTPSDEIIGEKRNQSPHRNLSTLAVPLVNQMDRTLSPLRRNPSNYTPRKQSPLPASSLLRPIPTAAVATITRDESRPGRNSPGLVSFGASDSKTPDGPEALAKRRSNAQFSQALSRFQTLATQNPQDAIKATSEVTSRAIAGIYIPGSLREQAVRNLSKSRERGKSRVRGMARGMESQPES